MTPTNEAGHGLPAGIIERLAAAKDQLPRGSDERNAVWQAIEYLRKSGTGALSRGVPDFHDCKQASNEMAEMHARLLTAADDLLSYAIKRSNRVPAAPAAPAAAGAQGEAPAMNGADSLRVWECPACPTAVEYLGKAAPPCPQCDTTMKLDPAAKPAPQPAAADGGVRERARELLARELREDMRPGAAEQAESGELDHDPAMRAISAALSSHRQAGDGLSKFRELAERWRTKKTGLSALGCANELIALVEKGAGNG